MRSNIIYEQSFNLTIHEKWQLQTGIFELKPGAEEYPRLDLHRGHFKEDIGDALQKFGADSICVGSYTHVFVDPASGNKPVKIPDLMRKSLERISISEWLQQPESGMYFTFWKEIYCYHSCYSQFAFACKNDFMGVNHRSGYSYDGLPCLVGSSLSEFRYAICMP